MKRRNFLLLASGGVITVAIPAVYYFKQEIKYDKSLIKPQVLTQIWETQTINKIGKAYLKQVPQEAYVNTLVPLILGGLSLTDNTPAIGQKIKQDFKSKQTTMLEGWVLSQTEARQCALFSLTQTS